ncbi:immunity protein YezG family protein [Clostridium vincentii]|uniref:Putative antitoxin YezG n=1 Tax=Clostridium vincentii TaxID=52704 RepID=A0A2T0BDS3_9CLOT|nr:immunity protein YezG family protein [Clostridium vincentii]PRR82003.1 putative antitoxin YezG [Clostridium vincentii]
MNENNYKLIINELIKVIPDGWGDIIFYGEFGEGSYSFEYYVKFEDEEFIQCFKLKDISKTDIMSAFDKINTILKLERVVLSDEKRWTNCTLLVNKSGKFKMDYDYTDLTEKAYAYQSVWKFKYLNITPSSNNKKAKEAVDEYLKINK